MNYNLKMNQKTEKYGFQILNCWFLYVAEIHNIYFYFIWKKKKNDFYL